MGNPDDTGLVVLNGYVELRQSVRAMTCSRDSALLWLALCFLLVWVSFAGPIRWLAAGTPLRGLWTLGVMPNVFAGLALTLWQAYGTRTGPVASASLAVTVLAACEIVQTVLPAHRADVWDVVASVVGAVPGAFIVYLRASRRAVPLLHQAGRDDRAGRQED